MFLLNHRGCRAGRAWAGLLGCARLAGPACRRLLLGRAPLPRVSLWLGRCPWPARCPAQAAGHAPLLGHPLVRCLPGPRGRPRGPRWPWLAQVPIFLLFLLKMAETCKINIKWYRHPKIMKPVLLVFKHHALPVSIFCSHSLVIFLRYI